MKFQTLQRVLCCFMALLILCFAVIRPIEVQASVAVAAGTACLVNPSVLIPAILVVLGIAVVSSDEFQSLCSDITDSVSGWFVNVDGTDYLPATEYNGTYYVDSSLADEVLSCALDAIDITYGFTGTKLTYLQNAMDAAEDYYGSSWMWPNSYLDFSDCYLTRIAVSGEAPRTFVVFTNGDCSFSLVYDSSGVAYFCITTDSGFQAIAYSDDFLCVYGCSGSITESKLFVCTSFAGAYSSSISLDASSSGLSITDTIGSSLTSDCYSDLISGAITVDNVLSVPISLTDADVVSKTGTVDIEYEDSTTYDDATTSGFLSSILDWLKRIWNAICSLASSITSPIISSISNLSTSISTWWDSATSTITSAISDFSTSVSSWFDSVVNSLADIWDWLCAFPSELWQAIVDALAYVFVPSEGYLDSKVLELRAAFPLFDSIILSANELRDFFNFSSASPIIYIPLGNSTSWELGGTTVFVDLTWYAQYKPTVDLIISAFLWLFFLWRVFLSLPGIIRGSSGLVGAISVSSGKSSSSTDISIR